jgi:hypothetical protein
MSPSLAIVKVWWLTISCSASLNWAASMRSPSARPTAVAMPWPSGPVVDSIPGEYLRSGWPAVGDPTWRKFSMSSSDIG